MIRCLVVVMLLPASPLHAQDARPEPVRVDHVLARAAGSVGVDADPEPQPEPAPAPERSADGLWPNEPAGYVLIADEDGTRKDWRGFGNNSALWMRGTSQGGPPTVVDDPTNPTGSGKAVEFRVETGTHGDGSNQIFFDRSAFQSVRDFDEVYIGLYLYRDASYDHPQKWFYVNVGGKGYFNGGCGTPGCLRYTQQGVSPAVQWSSGSTVVIPANRWVLVEFILKRQSRASIQDGVMQIMRTMAPFTADATVRLAGKRDVQYSDDAAQTFTGVEWYSFENDPMPSERWYRVGGLRISGVPTR